MASTAAGTSRARSADPASASPEALAERFVAAVLERAEGRGEAVRRFREDLLGPTLRHARRRSRYYREVLPDSVENARSLEDLRELPILTKSALVERSLDLRTALAPGMVFRTTGTTGLPIAVYRTRAEISFLKRFQKTVAAYARDPDRELLPLILTIGSGYHGQALDLPMAGHRLSTGLFDPVLLEQIMGLLRISHALPGVEPRVSVLTGVYCHLQWLTQMLLRRGFDFGEACVERLYCTGGYLTSRWQAVLERTWSAAVIPSYSITEVFTYANQCRECRGYHFLPNVIPELVCPMTRSPLERGTGELLLTGLVPFCQGQPVLRYATRDLFTVEREACTYGDVYRFVGRFDHSCVAAAMGAGSPLVVGAAIVQDLLDAEPEVATTPFFRGLPGVADDGVVGKPDHAMRLEVDRAERPKLTIEVALRYAPALYPAAARRLEARLRKELRRRCADLDRALAAHRIELRWMLRGPHTEAAVPPPP